MRRIGFLLAAALLATALYALLPVRTTLAASKTWTGAGGDGLWTTPANWSGGTLPASSDDVVLDNTAVAGSYTVTLNAATAQTVRSVQVGYAGNSNKITLAVSGGTVNVLTVSGGGATALHVTDGGVLSNQSSNSTRGIRLANATDVFKMSGNGTYIHASASNIPQLNTGTTAGSNYDFAITSVFENQSGNANSFDATPVYGAYVLNKSGTNSADKSLTISGDASVLSGTLNVATSTTNTFTIGGNVSISSGAFLQGTSTTGTATLNIAGNVTGAGTLTGNAASGGTTNITIGGNLTSQINFTTGANSLTFSGGAASVSFAPANSNPTVKNVTVAAGKTVTLGATVTQAPGTSLTVAAGGVFATGVGYTNNGSALVGGTFQINGGGFITGAAPTYNAGSTLKYSTGGPYGAGTEWAAGPSGGAGVPQNVQISTGGTNVNFGSSTSPRSALGNVTIDSGTTLTLSTALGGDLKVGGDWKRSGSFVPNGRAVTFNGAGTQTVALGSAGTEAFAYLIVDKASGNLTFGSSPATSVNVTGPGGGSALQIVNEGGIDLNGNGLTLNGGVAGTNVLVGGAAGSATRNVTGAGTFAVTNGAKSVTNNNGKTLAFGPGVNVTIFQAVDFGASLTTVNGTLTIGGGGSVNANPPTYGAGSTLVYDCACVYTRSTEWSTTSGPGYPHHVRLNNAGGTDLDLGGASPGTLKQLAGNLTVNSGVLYMDFAPNQMTAPLNVLGGVTIAGGGFLRLSSLSGGDLKVRGDLTVNGTLTPNDRAVYFEGGAAQAVNAASGSLSIPYVRVDKTGGTVQLGNTNLTALGPAGGNSIEFGGSTSTLTLGGRTLTLGSTVGTAASGSGLVGDTSAGLSLQNGGTGGAMGTLVFAPGGQALGSLTINRTGGTGSATLGSDLTVQDALTLAAGDLLTGPFTLTHHGTSSGTTDVVGNVRRTDLGAGARSFGNPNNQLSFQIGTAPAAVTFNLAKSAPAGVGFGYPTAVTRTYTITPAGGSGYAATLRLHYLDAELNGNAEGLLDFWRFEGATWRRVVKTLADPVTDNWIQTSAVTQLSPWTLAAGNALTKARLAGLKATRYGAGTLLEWKTGFEVDNLGFNVYRETAGRRVLLNPSLVAGSALVAGPNVAMTAGNSYSWADPAGGAGALYWLEEVDVDGRTTTYGPLAASKVAARGAKWARSPLVSQLTGGAAARDAQRQWLPPDESRGAAAPAAGGDAGADARARQRWLAARPSVKISVNAAGWYRVTREQLTGAGLSPSADPARLQLYAGGVELPLRVGSDGAVEFYGEGLDVPSTDTRVYWLTEGDTRGLRTDERRGATTRATRGGKGGTHDAPVLGDGAGEDVRPDGPLASAGVTVGPPAGTPSSFNYTLERRERAVYFSGLQNGEAENFFGRVVNTGTAAQTLTVRNRVPLDAPTTALEVSLQGVTAGEHHVAVVFNGVRLGTLDFAGQTKKAAVFWFEPYLVRDGDNQVQLVASGAGDLSLTDYLRLRYPHAMRADDDRLRFDAPAGMVRVGGFSTPNVRVVDVTDPASPAELPLAAPAAPDGQGGWGVRFAAPGAGRRRLFAFADTQVSSPASVVANHPSRWSSDPGLQADMVVVTYGEFAGQVAPLVARREAEGLAVEVVDVEDLFDEFSYGEHTPQAVRDFLAWAKANWARAPSYVLLVGDGSYDPRDYLGRGRYDLVPSKLVDAGAMETASDDWFADFDDDGISDLAVGRLPVRTQGEAAGVVNKIVSRASDSPQTSALLVADRDGADGYSFEAATDAVQRLLPGDASVARVNRRAQDASAVRSQIVAGVNSGPTVVNWMGHGSIDVWTGEGLLRGEDAPALANGSRLPLFVMMTCLNGYFEGTGLDSLAESVLKAEGGGAYAVWASSGMTEPAAQAEANRELYRILFTEGGAVRLGDAVRRAKSATADRDVRRTWVFFGDPSSRLR